MRAWLADRSLSIVLIVLWLTSWALQFVFQVTVVTAEAAAHGEVFQWADFYPEFFKDTFENWQSEFLQVFTFVVLTKHFIHRDSHESRDSQDRLEAKVDDILAHLDKNS